MPDKLTDKEIVKAWEDEIHLAEYVDSDFCNGVSLSLVKSTLDLINRLQEKDETRHKVFETKCEELEIAKTEAYKEFAERLIEKYGYYDWENKTIVYPEDEINNLLKELVGEDNAEEKE